MYNLGEVLAIENDVINKLGNPVLTKGYFKEFVAQELYKEWQSNPSDTRILSYAFPMIQNHIIKRFSLIKINNLDKVEVFNSLCVILLENLPKYKATTGTLYAYFNMILKYRLLDIFTAHNKYKDRYCALGEDWDTEVNNNNSFEKLLDFKIFITNLSQEQNSETLNKVIEALLVVLDDSEPFHAQDRKMLLIHLTKISGFPEELVSHILTNIITRYQHSILD
jgi:hypothetical protein